MGKVRTQHSTAITLDQKKVIATGKSPEKLVSVTASGVRKLYARFQTTGTISTEKGGR